VYLLYDLIRQAILKREKRLLLEFIRRRLSDHLFAVLYSLKKIIHGYNLETNSIGNILGQVNYTNSVVFGSIANQSYLGFQILKTKWDAHGILNEVIDSNLVLKYSSHSEITRLLQIVNNLGKLEAAFRNLGNFDEQAEVGIEFRLINGRTLNPTNEDGVLLVKITPDPLKYVVYDSGMFQKDDLRLLLKRFTLKHEAAQRVSILVSETLKLMKTWLPEVATLARRNQNYRIVKDFYSPNTDLLTDDVEIHVADIIQSKNEA
jgi:hypothetical protein